MPERIAPVTIDYAAIAADMPTVEKPAEPTAAAAPPPPAGEQPAEGAPAEKLPPEAEAPFKKGFDQLVKGQAELRAQRDALKSFDGLSKAVSPVQAAALTRALASGDPMAAMTALGFSYADIASRVAGAPAKPPEKPAEMNTSSEPAKDEDPEIAEIKATFRANRAEAQKSQILDGIKGALAKTPEKFSNIIGLDAQAGVMSVLDEIFARTGTLPSENALENIAIAAEELERRLSSGEIPLTKKQWEKLASLTTAPASGSTPARPPENRPGTAPVSAAKSLTNKTAAPPASVAPRPSEPDYAALAREIP